MPSLGDLLNKLAQKAGIPADNEQLKTLLTNPELSKLTLEDTLSEKIEAGLYDLDAAKAKLRPVLKAEILNGVDAEVMASLPEFEFDADSISEIKAIDSTTKRIKAIGAKIKDLESKKSGANKGDKEQYTAQINDLKAQLANAMTAKEQEIASIKQQADSELTQFALRSQLASYAYALDNVPKDVNVLTANQLLSQSLSSDQAEVVYDKTTGQMKLVKKDGTDFYDNTNTKVDAKTYVERVLAKNNMLKVSDPNPGNQTPAGVQTPPAGGASASRGSFNTALEAQLAEATKGFTPGN